MQHGVSSCRCRAELISLVGVGEGRLLGGGAGPVPVVQRAVEGANACAGWPATRLADAGRRCRD